MAKYALDKFTVQGNDYVPMAEVCDHVMDNEDFVIQFEANLKEEAEKEKKEADEQEKKEKGAADAAAAAAGDDRKDEDKKDDDKKDDKKDDVIELLSDSAEKAADRDGDKKKDETESAAKKVSPGLLAALQQIYAADSKLTLDQK